MGECEARTQGVPIAALSGRLRTQRRSGQRGQSARASFRKELLNTAGLRLRDVVPVARALEGDSRGGLVGKRPGTLEIVTDTGDVEDPAAVRHQQVAAQRRAGVEDESAERPGLVEAVDR